MKTLICLQCHKEFKTYDKRRKFCNHKCSERHQHELPKKPMEIRKCINCGNDFISKDKRRRFCKQSCSACFNNTKRGPRTEEEKLKISKSLSNYRSNKKVVKKCKNCKKDFVPDKLKRNYCSVECYNGSRKAMLRNEISYRTFRKILKRAFKEWKCPFCNWTHSFNIHHIEGRGNSNFDTLIMLCPSHHSMAHLGLISKEEMKKYAIGNTYTKEYLLENFYNGQNNSINFIKYDTDKTRAYAKEINEQKVTLTKTI